MIFSRNQLIIPIDNAFNYLPENILSLPNIAVSNEIVDYALFRLKQSYNPGPDGIPASVLVHGRDTLAPLLHYLLLAKWEKLSFGSTIITWLSSYLKDSFFGEKLKSQLSMRYAYTLGVPQGRRSPLLFALFINDVYLLMVIYYMRMTSKCSKALHQGCTSLYLSSSAQLAPNETQLQLFN